jgi:hypothetical protein
VPGSFNLQLDTRAPVVTWGAAAGTTAGELLQIGYTLDEPALVSATIRLADGRTIALTDTGLTLEALLPADTPDGNATISALVRDDVLNEATRTRTIHLTGTIVVPETPATPPAWPGRRVTPRPRRRISHTVASTSRGRARSIDKSRNTHRYLATGVASSSQRMSGGQASSSSSIARAGGRHLAELVAVDSSRAVSRATVRRHDGGDLEALAALGLL